MTDDLWNQSTIIQRMRAVVVTNRREETFKALQLLVTGVIHMRFPELTDLAHQKVMQTTSIEELHSLGTQLLTANEAGIHALLATTGD
jgi:hypothetical protein